MREGISGPREPGLRSRPASWSALLALAVLAAACESPVEPVDPTPVREPEAVPIAPAFDLTSATNVPLEWQLPLCLDPDLDGRLGFAFAGSDAVHLLCLPPVWNGAVIAFAHGYVNPGGDPLIPQDQIELVLPFALNPEITPDGGFGFAATSYGTNGLAIKDGAADMVNLAADVRGRLATEIFPGQDIGPVPIIVGGASEGGLVATLTAERFGGLFQGALSTCGPTGDFRRQLDYFGDFNVLFNYYFPAVFAGAVTPAGVDMASLPPDWPARVAAVVATQPGKVQELLRVAKVPVDPDAPDGALTAMLGILRYNVLATNDAIAKLGGSAFDNRRRWYRGSSNDFRLNFRGVQRFGADGAALAEVEQSYQTSGRLQMQYVSLHTTGDEIVKFVQQPIYRLKALANGSALQHSALPVSRFGHCSFEEADLAVGLGLLLLKMQIAEAVSVEAALPHARAKRTFRGLIRR